MPATIGTSGGNREAVEVWVGTPSGNKLVLEGYVGTPSGNKLFHTSAGLSVLATAPGGSVAGAGNTYVTRGPLEAFASGGAGPYSYLWERVSGATAVINDPEDASTYVQVYNSSAGSGINTATFVCTVTDAFGAVVVSNTVSVTVIFGS